MGNMPNLFIVADGMGGHNAGDYASKCTVETVVGEIRNSFEKNPTIIVKKAIETANRKIRELAFFLTVHRHHLYLCPFPFL